MQNAQDHHTGYTAKRGMEPKSGPGERVKLVCKSTFFKPRPSFRHVPRFHQCVAPYVQCLFQDSQDGVIVFDGVDGVENPYAVETAILFIIYTFKVGRKRLEHESLDKRKCPDTVQCQYKTFIWL